MAKSNLQKSWYDKNARERHFEPGDMVLLLLPSISVARPREEDKYLIQMPQRRNKKQTFHVNLLKKWESPCAEPMWRRRERGIIRLHGPEVVYMLLCTKTVTVNAHEREHDKEHVHLTSHAVYSLAREGRGGGVN